MSTLAGEEDQLAKATKIIEDLYELRDTYFPTNPDDKMAKLRPESDFALKILDSIPPGKFVILQFPKTVSI